VSAKRSSLIAMGDPQAPLSRVTDILRRHGLVRPGKRLRLRSGARLLSIGDHFDWGGSTAEARADAAKDGEALLRALSAHDADDVILLVGNHDLARVGELLDVTDDTFAALQILADMHYYGAGSVDDEAAFFRLSAQSLPSTEIVARDLSTYRASQQALVLRLLLKRRLRLAHAEDGLLYSHAGVTRKHLWSLGLDEVAPPDEVAAALNARLDEAVSACLRRRPRRPLVVVGLHRPGDGIGEGDGCLYHRPTYVEADAWVEPRRFDPRTLPRGLWQVIGHVRDKRCVEALGRWSVPKEQALGAIRHLVSVDGDVVYRHGPPPPRQTLPPHASVMIFIDGAMGACPPERYELFDSRRADVARVAA